MLLYIWLNNAVLVKIRNFFQKQRLLTQNLINKTNTKTAHEIKFSFKLQIYNRRLKSIQTHLIQLL